MKKFYIFAIAALAMAACSNDGSEPVNTLNQNDNLIRLSANIGSLTRASMTDAESQNTQFVSGKSIFVEAYKAGLSVTYTTGNYVTGNAGVLTGGLYYPADNSNIDICAFYPSNVSSSTTSFSVGADQTTAAYYQNYDLMYATKLTNIPRGSTTHGLTFNHALSKIVVTITNGSGVASTDIPNVSAVVIKNTLPTAGFTISAGAVGTITASGTAADIAITGTNKTNQAGIIVPQTLVAETPFIAVTYQGATYNYVLTSDQTFQPGKVYTYALTLNAQGLSLSSTQITNWDDNEGANSSNYNVTL